MSYRYCNFRTRVFNVHVALRQNARAVRASRTCGPLGGGAQTVWACTRPVRASAGPIRWVAPLVHLELDINTTKNTAMMNFDNQVVTVCVCRVAAPLPLPGDFSQQAVSSDTAGEAGMSAGLPVMPVRADPRVLRDTDPLETVV
uniref:Uncharacterized protein n=1 Tax=Branchiostoma floridae TaxID=7739 RepID=C3Z0A2_BRAFL|eukprot:XP_002597938.1 hypothetical protein BRAFLDRAFT_79820 [Branchiostoma floridae]